MELKLYLNILARRWKIIVLVALIIVCLAAVGSQFVSQKYRAEALLRAVTPLGGSSGDTNYQTTFAVRLVNTYARIATSDQVTDKLKQKLGLKQLPDISVKVIPDSEIIQIIVESDNPSLAAKTANTLIDVLISYQDNVAKSSSLNALNILAARKSEIQTELAQYQQEHDQLVQVFAQTTADMTVLDGQIKLKEASYQNLQSQYEDLVISESISINSATKTKKDALTKEIERMEKELNTLNQQYKELSTKSNEYQQKITLVRQTIQIAQTAYSNLLYQYDNVSLAYSRQESARNIEIASSASEPFIPTGPGRIAILSLGVICGLIAGLVAAFIIDNLDTRIFSLDQIRSLTATPIIGSISIFQEKLSQNIKKNPSLRRDYRLLRAKLQTLIHEGSINTIMVTSPNKGEGKSAIVFELASEMSQNKMKVLVVDANLHMPQQHKLFGVTAERGLSDSLVNEDGSLEDLILRNIKPGLDLLPNLTESDNLSELLGCSRWKSF
ncbi:MAG TPA: Wzz/FepE/Etk N-terminal domain-containing protein, partial [Nitrosomonas sp.]|nr:Wzz/FepE/Etk N-terminal domain-containing protein [Nitrosomonas sp.]